MFGRGRAMAAAGGALARRAVARCAYGGGASARSGGAVGEAGRGRGRARGRGGARARRGRGRPRPRAAAQRDEFGGGERGGYAGRGRQRAAPAAARPRRLEARARARAASRAVVVRALAGTPGNVAAGRPSGETMTASRRHPTGGRPTGGRAGRARAQPWGQGAQARRRQGAWSFARAERTCACSPPVPRMLTRSSSLSATPGFRAARIQPEPPRTRLYWATCMPGFERVLAQELASPYVGAHRVEVSAHCARTDVCARIRALARVRALTRAPGVTCACVCRRRTPPAYPSAATSP